MPISKKELSRYPLDTFQLIPLHRPKATKTMPNGKVMQVGKAPLDGKWGVRKYDSKAVLRRCLDEQRNVGVRLTAEQLVIDVDPRNGGNEGFAALCHDIGIDSRKYPRGITGSGGFHVYMSKPADVLVRDTLQAEEYDGVEFKSKGRQVVAAGSVHPNGNPYYWSPDHPRIEDGLPPIPKNLLNVIKRPPRSEVNGGGQYSPDQIAKALEKLDVTNYDSNALWLPIMQACHHASAGDARHEFIEWSCSDPKFAKDAFYIGKRWDSLHADKNDGVTYKTLERELRNNGGSGAMVAAKVDPDDFPDDDADVEDRVDDDMGDADDDAWLDAAPAKPKKKKAKVNPDYAMFEVDDDGEDDGVLPENFHGYGGPAIEALNQLNSENIAIMDQGKFRIMQKKHDHELKRDAWEGCNARDFETYFNNRSLERDPEEQGLTRNAPRTIPLGRAWLTWPRRRTVNGIIFEPDTSRGERDDYLNLWTGWGMDPDTTGKGTCHYMTELIDSVIADGDTEVSSYVWNWLALMFQQPSILPQTALVFRGEQGVGKGTLGNTLVKLIGKHALSISNHKHLTGQFNAHFRNLLFLFADEATSAYDRKGEGLLRNLVSEPSLSIEKKGVDVAPARNLIHLMISTNERWVIAAMSDERRFVCQEVSPIWKGQSAKWTALHDELESNNNLGYRAFMNKLMMHPIPDAWDVRKIPNTRVLTEQKIYTMGPVKKFFNDALCLQTLPCAIRAGDEEDTTQTWGNEPVRFFLESFRSEFTAFCNQNGINAGSAGRSTIQLLQGEIADCFKTTAKVNVRARVPESMKGQISVGNDGKAPAVELPSLWDAVADFERSVGVPSGALKIKRPKTPDHGFG